ncbi:MAG: hypothetical protein A2511_12130 [Deltaproteobacteria bacterium RIFOXYD12_FULL_50_9]|nr:MAG: hypothetical protein A2511_12130 [Deltaproteobacteria bacterium RIFOXYD12_FULL_50_9]
MNRILLILFVFPLFWILPVTQCPAAPAATNHGPTHAKSTESQLQDQQKKYLRITKGIKEHQNKIQNTRKQETSLLTELEKIEQKLNSERIKLDTSQQELHELELSVSEKEKQLSQTQNQSESLKIFMEKRLAAYYRMGTIGLINTIFSKNSLPELLTFNEYFRCLIQHDQQVIYSFRKTITELTESRNILKEDIKKRLEFIDLIKEQEKQLASTRKNRMALFNRVNTEKKLYQQALNEMEDAAAKLADTVNALKEQTAEENKKTTKATPSTKSRTGSTTGFAALKGRLNPPVNGKVITKFGKNTKGKFGITTIENGIDIKTETGAKIKAIHNGKVVYAGQLRGYGNLLIIDHGQQYYSLTSRAAQFYKQVNDQVTSGEIIGEMGEQGGGLLGEGLHFEIRHGATPENPLLWVNNAKLTIQNIKAK